MTTAAHSRKPKSAYTIGVPEDRILRALHRFYFLTPLQVQRRFYSPSSLRDVQRRLQHLGEHQYATTILYRKVTRTGSSPMVYTLDRRGRQYLASLGMDVPQRLRQSEERERSAMHLSHTLAVNDVLISAELLCERLPQLSIERLVHERDFKRLKLREEVRHGENRVFERVPAEPDGFIHFVEEGANHPNQPVALEIDMGTMTSSADWRAKIAAYIQWYGGAYEQLFGMDFLTFAVVVIAGQRRLEQLLQWTRVELETLGKQDYSELFQFSALPPDTTDPVVFWLSPSWQHPTGSRSQPLLELEVGAG